MSKKKPKTFLEIYQSLRRDWGGVHPATKVIKDKTVYTRKEKHKQKMTDAKEIISREGV